MNYSPTKCPNQNCKAEPLFIKKGFHFVRHLNRKFRIFQCKACKRYFTSRTFRLDYRHKRSDLNKKIALLLVEGNSLRGISRIEGLTYKSTYKKFLWMRKVVEAQKKEISFHASELFFDESETIEHTKCKPLNIALVANEKYQILSMKVAVMPAKGRLAAISRKKYGWRANERDQKILQTLTEVKMNLISAPAVIKSDMHPSYPKLVQTVFPGIVHRQYLAKEKKKKYQERLHENLRKRIHDPIFAVNHGAAKIRDRIKRLCRRSWCTTKRVENLQLHLDLFVLDNLGLLKIRPKSAVGLADFGGFG